MMRILSEEHALMRSYAIAMCMLALLDEWKKQERMGAVAKIYNSITLKNNNFHKQIYEVEIGKKKKVSKKCELFEKASAYAVVAWKRVIQEKESHAISANTTIHNLFRLDSKNFQRVYSLDEALFRKLNNNHCGVTLASCRVARLLVEAVEEVILEGVLK